PADLPRRRGADDGRGGGRELDTGARGRPGRPHGGAETRVTRLYYDRGVTLTLLEGTYAICRLEPGADVPAFPEGARGGVFESVTRTADELSIVCEESRVPGVERCERGWSALKLEGPFPFSAVGVVASLADPLAGAGIPIFVVSTFDTD